MSTCALPTLLIFHLAVGVASHDGREVRKICAGKEFHLPVDSIYSSVTFTPNDDGPKRVLLEKTDVKDPRFKWTRNKVLILEEVTHSDQGVYAFKLLSGFTYELIRLIVTECAESYHRKYGEKFEKVIPDNGVLLEFTPRGAPPEAVPIVLWNRTDPETSHFRRGRVLQGSKVWRAERVTQDDQGNYTVKDKDGNMMSRSILFVRGHSFKVTRFSKESLHLPLFLPIRHVHLIFTPTRHRDESTQGSFGPKPPGGPVHLIHKGQITEEDKRYRGLISLGWNGTTDEIIIAKLTSVHDGMYEIKDLDGNPVSSTLLQVTAPRKMDTWQTFFQTIRIPGGLLVSLIGLFLFVKRYPSCNWRKIFTCLRANRTPPANAPRVNIQDYSQPVSGSSGYNSPSQRPGTPRKCTPRASPTRTGYVPVSVGTPKTQNQRPPDRMAAGNSSHQNSTTRETTKEEERNIFFPVPGASDCLHSSEDCVQFQIKKDKQECFSVLPLDTNTSETSSVYISKNLDI